VARQLVLIRHAKSAEGAVDMERVLNPRGERDCGAVGRWLQQQDITPERVVVSPAERARRTWAGAARFLAAPEPEVDERIYENDAELLLDVIRETPAELQSVVLVGHNPSFGALADDLDDGTGDAAALDGLRAGFPTSAVAVFEFDGDWLDVAPRALRLAAYAVPRG
jgi:phosphohistidine phosphatase